MFCAEVAGEYPFLERAIPCVLAWDVRPWPGAASEHVHRVEGRRPDRPRTDWRVTVSNWGRTLYCGGDVFRSLNGAGFKENDHMVGSGEGSDSRL